nr:hypothetical protein RP007_00711 [Rhizobium sp. P007]
MLLWGVFVFIALFWFRNELLVLGLLFAKFLLFILPIIGTIGLIWYNLAF